MKVVERSPRRDQFQIRRPQARELARAMKAARKKPARGRRGAARRVAGKKVLVIDVGGTSVKILATGEEEHRSFPSGPRMTPSEMVIGVKNLAADWDYDVISMGYPGPVLHGRPLADPHNLGKGWVGFDFARAFGDPVKVMNDAANASPGEL